MLKQAMNNSTSRFWYVLFGLVETVCGIDLLTNEHYFFWPPQFQSLMNDDRIDILIIAVGIGLILYSIIGKHSNLVIGILLAMTASFGSLLAVAFYVHMVFARQAMLSIPLALAVFFVVAVLKVALSRNTRK